ncbi:hypothetical protein AXK12_06220 [Cephaloticoccus capnophilus]|uniref:Uncharacterized protein n=1 Tax=Cephaloticoccus capnophilus TaxID=1548208 RepID=A0A139SKD4_9BACT|nr:hypothetical protein AXK12_06220 [Cephaloticoccus capnophilus]
MFRVWRATGSDRCTVFHRHVISIRLPHGSPLAWENLWDFSTASSPPAKPNRQPPKPLQNQNQTPPKLLRQPVQSLQAEL